MGGERKHKMTEKNIKEKLSEVFSTSYSAQVYFVLKKDSGFVLRLADFENKNTELEIRKLFSEYICETIIKNENLKICELSTDDEQSNAIYHYDYDEYPEELSLFNNFCLDDVIDEVQKFDFSKDDLRTLRGYIIYLGSMDNGMMLFKQHYPILLIKRNSFLFGVKKSKKRFEKLDIEDVIRLNGTVQLICIEGEMYVLDLKVLEKNLGFTQLTLNAAKDTVEIIKSLDLIEDIEVLNDSVEEIAFARKLSKVKTSSPVIKNKIPKKIIVNFTKTNPALKETFKYSDDGQKIRLDTKKSKLNFLKVLNDSFLYSQLTEQYYEALAKDDISAVNKNV
ncbi:MAG: anti-phage protein KwaB [Eubacterium sp.]